VPIHIWHQSDRTDTTEAAIAAGVSVAEVDRAIDRKIVPKILYNVSEIRTVRMDACLCIAFYFETVEFLTTNARQKAILDGVGRYQSWSETRNCKVEESRSGPIGLQQFDAQNLDR
jgi:hypothetical protein